MQGIFHFQPISNNDSTSCHSHFLRARCLARCLDKSSLVAPASGEMGRIFRADNFYFVARRLAEIQRTARAKFGDAHGGIVYHLETRLHNAH